MLNMKEKPTPSKKTAGETTSDQSSNQFQSPEQTRAHEQYSTNNRESDKMSFTLRILFIIFVYRFQVN